LSGGDAAINNGWKAPDNLIYRVHKLKSLLEKKVHRDEKTGFYKTVVIYVHCYCGHDRTGELIGTFDMFYNQANWEEVNNRNHHIGDRPIGCKNYRAMQWMCLWEEGQHQTDLGCTTNYPCSVFWSPPADNPEQQHPDQPKDKNQQRASAANN